MSLFTSMVDFVDNMRIGEARDKGYKAGHEAALAPEIQEAYDEGFQEGFEEHINDNDD